MKSISTIFIALCVAMFASVAAAKGGKKSDDKVTIIHWPSKQAIEITIDRSALDAHIRNHGDCIVGESGEHGCDSEPPGPVCVNTASSAESVRVEEEFDGELLLTATSVYVDDVTWTGTVCSAAELDEILNTPITAIQHLEVIDYSLLQVVTTEVETPCFFASAPTYEPEPGETAFDLGTLVAACVIAPL